MARILIVDDESLVRRAMTRILTSEGYSVVTAGDGEEALRYAADTIFDLASMTKVLATTTIVMRLVDEGRLTLDDPVRQWIDGWQRVGRRTVTLTDLLEHASGLPGERRGFTFDPGCKGFHITALVIVQDRIIII